MRCTEESWKKGGRCSIRFSADFFEHGAFVSHNSLSKSAQYLRSSEELVWRFGSADSWSNRADHGEVRSKWERTATQLRKPEPQEVTSLVQTPRRNDDAVGNRLRECLGERSSVHEGLWSCSIRKKSLYWDDQQDNSRCEWWFFMVGPQLAEKTHNLAKIQIPGSMQWSKDKLQMDQFFKFILHVALTSAELKFFPLWETVQNPSLHPVRSRNGKTYCNEKRTQSSKIGDIMERWGNSCVAAENSVESSERSFWRIFFQLKKGSGKTFLPIEISMEIHLNPPSRNWSWSWCATMIKTKEKLTVLFIGNRWVQNCDSHFTREAVRLLWFRLASAHPQRRQEDQVPIRQKISRRLFFMFALFMGVLVGAWSRLIGGSCRPSRWGEFLFRRGCSSGVTSTLRWGLIAGGRESKESRRRRTPQRLVGAKKSTLSQQMEASSGRCPLDFRCFSSVSLSSVYFSNGRTWL